MYLILIIFKNCALSKRVGPPLKIMLIGSYWQSVNKNDAYAAFKEE